jgi:hypothetical protein
MWAFENFIHQKNYEESYLPFEQNSNSNIQGMTFTAPFAVAVIPEIKFGSES